MAGLFEQLVVRKLYNENKDRFISDRDESGNIIEYPVLGNLKEFYGCGFCKIDSQINCLCGQKGMTAEGFINHLRESSPMFIHGSIDGGNWIIEPRLYKCTQCGKFCTSAAQLYQHVSSLKKGNNNHIFSMC